MISVTFTSDVENIVATEHLYQWDNGQKLSISGVGTTADIHFANKKREKALVVTPTVTSGKMVAPIPNSLLADPYPIIAYVYVPSDNGSKTIKSVIINVEERKQPSDFVITEDEAVTTIETISQRANALMANLQSNYNAFKITIQNELDDMVANTTVPNADTVDGKHASDFGQNFGLWDSGDIKDKILEVTCNGFVLINSGVSSMPFDGSSWFGIVQRYSNNLKSILVYRFGTGTAHNLIYMNGTWIGWKNLADGGNAETAKTATNATKATTATTASTANKAGTLATTPTNVCLRNISFGTAEPQVTDSSAEGYVAPGALYGQYV